MQPLPTIRQMHYFAALAEHRSFSRAAKACNISQSTLSAAIRAFEEALEATLVDRSGRLAGLTEAGEAVLARVRAILADVEGLARVARPDAAPLSGRLRLGVIPSIAPYLLPQALPAIRAHHPQLRLYLREELTRVLVEELREGRLDVILIAFPYRIDGVETEIIGTDGFLFAASRSHRLARRSRVLPSDFAGEPLLLLDDGHCLRDHVLAMTRSERTEGDDVRATSLTTLVQMADNGLGVTLLPEIAVQAGVTQGTGLVVVPVDDPRANRAIGLAWRRHHPRASEFRLLADRLRPFLAPTTGVAALAASGHG